MKTITLKLGDTVRVAVAGTSDRHWIRLHADVNAPGTINADSEFCLTYLSVEKGRLGYDMAVKTHDPIGHLPSAIGHVAEAAIRPQVLLIMDGGIIHEVIGDRPVDVTILDYDTDGATDDEVLHVPREGYGERCYHSTRSTDVVPGLPVICPPSA